MTIDLVLNQSIESIYDAVMDPEQALEGEKILPMT